MKHIAYLCLSHGWGGLEMNQIRNAKAMQGRGHAVLILGLNNSIAINEAQKLQLPYYIVRKKPSYYNWLLGFELAKLLIHNGYQELIFRNNREMSLAASISFFARKKVRVHYFMEMAFGGKKKQWFRTLRYAFFSTWNCPLPYLADQVLENAALSEKKIRQIPSGIRFEKKAKQDKQTACHQLGWPSEGKIIGVVGRIDPKKRQDFVWEMFAMRPHENEHLVFIGSSTADEAPEFEEELKLKIAAHPKGKNVIWAGFQENMSAVYQATDVLIMPAINETFGMATLEAQQAKCPVVGSNNGGTAELIGLYGGGLTFECENQDDLSYQINEIFKGAFPSVQMEALTQHFSFDHVCDRIENEVLN